MTSIEIYGSITEDHKLDIQNKKRLVEELRQCQPCEVVITIKKRGKRSTAQNNFYWGVCIQEIRLRLKELGHRMTPEDIHTMLKLRFIPVTLMDDDVVIATIPGSTAELNRSEMMEYLDRVIEWARDTLEITIPPSDKSLSMNF